MGDLSCDIGNYASENIFYLWLTTIVNIVTGIRSDQENSV